MSAGTGWRVVAGFASVGLGASLASLDTSVNIALPGISSAFSVGLAGIQWIVICYVLTYSSLMLVCGKVGDLFGYRLVFRAGLLVSVGAYILCSLPTSYGWLLAARMLQGIGTALALSCGPALATSLVPESQRTRALAIFGTMSAAGAAVGPSLGGVLVELFGWSAVFWFRAPLSALALVLSLSLASSTRSTARSRFDLLGAVLLAATMTSLLMAVVTSRLPWAPAWLPIVLAALGVAVLLAFIAWERRMTEPILRPAIFADGIFVLQNLASVAMNCASFSILLLVPYFLVRAAHLSAVWGGLVMALSAVGAMLGAAAASRLAVMLGRRRLAALGLAVCGVALCASGTATAIGALPIFAACLLVQGLGAGVFQVAYTDIVTATLPLRDRGVAGSLAMVTRTLGVVSGASLLSALFVGTEKSAVAAGVTAPQAFLDAFATGMQAAGAGLLVLLALSFLRPSTWLARDTAA